ncbi:hypothetical protein TURU_129665 [Turdus rufiventris]|nr:hypothetical protein TURU_129665 [Turdus rufiventris]
MEAGASGVHAALPKDTSAEQAEKPWSVLVPTLFNIFINNKDSGIEPSASLKMTPKLSGAVESLEEKDQKDLDRLGKKTHENLLKFNKFLRVSWDNPQYQYRLGAEWIENIPV